MIRQELLVSVMPIFLGSHQNANIMLHYAWNCPIHQSSSLKQMILAGMADWYLRGPDDPVRLARLLEVAHDLKALSMLLNVPQFAFVLDMACMASRREYLKLDKWISDKIQEHGVETQKSFFTVLSHACSK